MEIGDIVASDNLDAFLPGDPGPSDVASKISCEAGHEILLVT